LGVIKGEKKPTLGVFRRPSDEDLPLERGAVVGGPQKQRNHWGEKDKQKDALCNVYKGG